jgi:hypothetical protein
MARFHYEPVRPEEGVVTSRPETMTFILIERLICPDYNGPFSSLINFGAMLRAQVTDL